MRVVYHPAAVNDLTESAKSHDERVPGLGADFLDEVDRTVSGIAESPVRYAIVRGNIRRCMLRRFPYGVYYHKTSEGIRILVIKHHSRHPDYGLDRE